jgi:beta-fructofuranosidase
MRTRPGYHVTAPRNWLNDPNAPILWRGVYHLFYQHNPDAAQWGLMRWGHTTSPDLVRWTDRGIAMAPSDDADVGGCWSGTAHEIDGRPVIHYTGVTADQRQVVLRVVGDDELGALVRDPQAPVVPGAEPGMGTRHQRDPFLLPYDGGWRMLLGTGLEGEDAGAVVAWHSDDARTWRYGGVVLSRPAGDPSLETGPVWECPQLVRMGDDWVLIVSVQTVGPVCPYAVWFLGDFDGARFTPRALGVLDAGDVFYAPAVAAGTGDRCLVWGWIQESVALRRGPTEDFAGALSMPRDLSVSGDRVVSHPAPELDALWAEPVELTAGAVVPEFRLRLRAAGPATVVLGRDGQDRPVRLRFGDGRLRVEAAAEYEADAGAEITVYADRSIVEIFAADGAAMTFRVDPELDCSEGVRIEAGTLATADIARRR